MAKTKPKTTIDDEDFVLLCDYPALLIAHAKTEDAAKRLILDYYAEAKPKSTRYRFQPFNDKESNRAGAGVPPASWRGSAEKKRYGIYVHVEWENSTVVKELFDTGSPHIRKALKHLNEVEPLVARIEIRFVQLPRSAASKMLRWAGLLPKLARPSPSPSPTATVTKLRRRGAADGWIYNHMKNHKSEILADDYVAKVHELCPYDVSLRRVGNIVGRYRNTEEFRP